MNSRATLIWLGMLAMFVACGCGQPRAAVEGAVRYADGTPFAGGGFVVLEGTVAGKAIMARGAIGSDGRFQLSSRQPDDGVIPGSYRVRLVPPAGQVDRPTAALPYDEKFLDFETSGVSCEVNGRRNELRIDLGPRP